MLHLLYNLFCCLFYSFFELTLQPVRKLLHRTFPCDVWTKWQRRFGAVKLSNLSTEVWPSIGCNFRLVSFQRPSPEKRLCHVTLRGANLLKRGVSGDPFD